MSKLTIVANLITHEDQPVRKQVVLIMTCTKTMKIQLTSCFMKMGSHVNFGKNI